jgi:plasmid stabilization system protein ParE
MKVIFTDFAKFELSETIAFYELEYSGLGKRFKKEVHKSLLRIQQFPLAWPVERNEVRKYIMHRFPYKILYSIEKDCILILAVAHQHRKPDYRIDSY